MFAIGSAAILLAGLLFPFRSGVIVHFGSIGYTMSGRATCFIIAAVFCLFAAVYSLWMLLMNAAAAEWHFWLTSASIAAFAMFFLLLGNPESDPHAPSWAVTVGVFSATAFISAQCIFAVNLTQAVNKLAHIGLAPRIT